MLEGVVMNKVMVGISLGWVGIVITIIVGWGK